MVISYNSKIDRLVLDFLSMPLERLLNLITIELIPRIGIGNVDIGYWYQQITQEAKK